MEERLTRVVIDLANTRENNKTLTNQLTVMEAEKKDLAAEHTKLKQSYEKLVALFQPLIKVWNAFIKDELDPNPWLDGVIKEAGRFAEKCLGGPLDHEQARAPEKQTAQSANKQQSPAPPQSDRDYGPGM